MPPCPALHIIEGTVTGFSMPVFRRRRAEIEHQKNPDRRRQRCAFVLAEGNQRAKFMDSAIFARGYFF